MTKTATKLGMLVAVAVLAACGNAPVTLQELQVQPPVTEVTEHLRAGVAAIAVYSDGTQQDVTAQVEWSSLDAAVATAAAGYIQGGQPGSTYLTASYAGLTSQARVDVVAADLLALTVVTDAAARPAGLTAQATASGAFSDGSTRDVTAAVSWTTSGAAATVDAAGRIQAAAVGQVDVVATLDGVAAAAPFEVTAAQVVALAFQDLAAALPLGLTADVRLVATYTDGSTAEVAAQAVLEVADGGVATVDAAGSIGILSATARKLRGVAAGATTLTATFDGLTVSAPVEILPATLQSIAIAAPAGRVKKGEVVLLSATGAFSDGSEADLTGQLTWTSGDQNLALVYSWMAPGSIFARENGTVTIRATDPVSGLSAEYQLEIR